MKFDQLIQKLLPKDDKFFTLLEESAQNLVNAAEVMEKIAHTKNKSEIEVLINKIHDHEHEGDTVTHRIFSELNSTFVTPLDREDIHTLASSLDDILDHMDGSAGRFVLYKLKSWPPRMAQLADILRLSINELHRGVRLLRNIQQFDELQKVFLKVNEYENAADAVFEQAVAELFEKEKSPIQIIKLKEIYVGLETATDKCEDVANVLEGIVIKHA
jgi:predicted phosphate transport protein (TIGR00153 family)